MKTKKFTITYERDEGGWWVATVRRARGVHTQGRSIDEARRRVREALALAIGDEKAERAQFIDDVRLPADVKRALAQLRRAIAAETAAQLKARKARARVATQLTKDLHLSRRDAAELTGYSFQRIHQLAHGG